MTKKKSIWEELDEAFPPETFEESMRKKQHQKLLRAKAELLETLRGGR